MDNLHFVGWLISTSLESCEDLPEAFHRRKSDNYLIHAYLTTSLTPAKEWFNALCEAFKGTNFELSLCIGQTPIKKWSSDDGRNKPDNIKIFNSLPAKKAIEASDIVISHGGSNTIHAALLAGKPMLILHNDYEERYYNGAQINRLGIGINSPPARCNGRDILEDVQRLLSDTRFYKKAIKHRKRAKDLGGPKRAVDLIEQYFG